MPRPYHPPLRTARHRQALPHAGAARPGNPRARVVLPLLALLLIGGVALAASFLQSERPPVADPGPPNTPLPKEVARPAEPVLTPSATPTSGVEVAGAPARPSPAAPASALAPSPPGHAGAPAAPGPTPGVAAVGPPVPTTAPSGGVPPAAPGALPQASPVPRPTTADAPAASPVAASAPPSAASQRPANASTPPFFAHQVRAGETVRSIAAAYGVSAASIIRESALDDPDLLLIGQVLTIPRESGALHRVHAGQSLGQVAAAWGRTVEQILAANPHIPSSAAIQAGDVLLIPDQSGSVTTGSK